jgi:hypothetical protein
VVLLQAARLVAVRRPVTRPVAVRLPAIHLVAVHLPVIRPVAVHLPAIRPVVVAIRPVVVAIRRAAAIRLKVVAHPVTDLLKVGPAIRNPVVNIRAHLPRPRKSRTR